MIAREWMDYLRLAHGSYNAIVTLFFLYQGWLGLRIRKERTGGGRRDFSVIRRHRNIGPPLVLLGILGYLAGATLVCADKGHLFEFPYHAVTGAGIAVFLAVTFLVSRKIKGPLSPWRTPHLILGIAIIGAYVLQLFLGLNILL